MAAAAARSFLHSSSPSSVITPQHGGQGRLACRTGSAAEADARLCPRNPSKVARGDEQRVPGVPDAHAQRHNFGAYDVASRRPGLQGIRLALRR
nr:unnamed protein product [Digitaria exilis]